MPLRDRLVHFLNGTLYFNAYLLRESLMMRMIRRINNFGPEVVRGLASLLYGLSKFAIERGLRLRSPRVVISTGDTLTPLRREVIAEAFGAEVRNFYGAREAASMAGECREGRMHAFTFVNLIEVLDSDGRAVGGGELGRVVVTPLHNLAMPLLRYEIGDMVRVEGGGCGCGSSLPILGHVEGRMTEFVVLRDGSLLGGEFFEGVFRFEDWVEQFQVIQESPEDLRILLVVKRGSRPDVTRAEEKIRRVLGGSVRIRWEFADEIPRASSGKFMYVMSEIRTV